MSVPISRVVVLKDRLESSDDAVLKKTLKELDRVDMTVDILKETGVGIAVNHLRYHDVFGPMARQLVSKWKQAAAGETVATSNGYGSSHKDHTSTPLKRFHAGSSTQYSSSPSPPTVSKKQKLDQRSKPEGKTSSTKPKPSKSSSRAHDDEESATFTAESGSFEQILGLNDYSQRCTATASKNHHSDYGNKARLNSGYCNTECNGFANGDAKRSEKKQRTTAPSESGYSSRATSVSSSAGVDWSKVLPSKLATEYRPQPRPAILDYDDDLRRNGGKSGADSDVDGIDFSQMKKNKLTKIYSGRRNIFLPHVPTLFESCIRVLCDNIDALGYIGGVPFDILKPVLQRATAAQLYRIEDWNPYLLEDTSDLWKAHCFREFKDVEPDWEEGETWRELYERLLAERDNKLNKLKQMISEQKAAKESAVRQAKMSSAKAPRDVRRRQMKYGTFRNEVQLPEASEIVQSRKNLDAHPHSKGVGRAFSHIYEDEQRQKEQVKNRKEKVAPLMAKSLKMMKLARSRN